MKMTKRTLILIDYENFHVRPSRLYDVSITEKGLKALVEKIEATHGKLTNKKDMIAVACWDDFKKQGDYLIRHFYDVLDTRLKGANVSDGYLIVRCMERIKDFDEETEVVLIGNDGVYSGLVHYLLSKGLNVHIYYWGEKVAEPLLINEDVQSYSLEELFEFDSGNHLSNGWFHHFEITKAEYAIISLALQRENNELFYVSTANKIYKNTKDPRYQEITTYEEACSFLDMCVTDGIFTIDRREVPGKEVPPKILILNKDNEKVKHVLNNQKRRTA
mgnify:CR=1 FL=1